MYICVCIYIYIYIYIFVCVCVCVYIYIYIYIYIETSSRRVGRDRPSRVDGADSLSLSLSTCTHTSR